MANTFKRIEQTFSIKLEGKIYFIYNSYIVNGSGFTFTIYKSPKMCYLRDNYFVIDPGYRSIVIIGKKYNYTLTKKSKKFKFDVIKYEKNILRCVCQKFPFESHSIYLNDDIMAGYFGTDPLFENDMILCKNIERKEKLIKINNE